MKALLFKGVFLNSFLLAAFFYSLVGLGSAGSYNAALTTNMRNFHPRDHGFVVGLSVSLFGLSAFIFSQLSRLFYRNSTYVANNASSSIPQPDAIDTYAFLLFLACATGAANFIATFGLKDLSEEVGNFGERRLSGIGNAEEEGKGLLGADTNGVEAENLALTTSSQVASSSFFQSVDAWILFVAFMLLTGTGLMFINSKRLQDRRDPTWDTVSPTADPTWHI